MVVRVTEGLWWLNECFDRGPDHEHVAVYLLESGGQYILIDSGSFFHRESILASIADVTDGEGPDAVVLSHTDYPHSANVRPLEERWGDYELVASCGVPSIQGLPSDARRSEVGESSTVQGRELRFVDPPLADRSHTSWMYDPDTGTLFTADGFGMRHDPGACESTATDRSDVSLDRVYEYHVETLTWLPYADPETLSAAVDDVFDRHDVRCVAPIHGPPIEGDALESYRRAFRQAVERIADSEALPGV